MRTFNNSLAAQSNDRYEVAMHVIGSGLSYANKGENHLPNEIIILDYLDASSSEGLRLGYSTGAFNQHGIRSSVDANHPKDDIYTIAADAAEKIGYSRVTETMRDISKSYNKY